MGAVIDQVELSEAPRVSLGGKEWAIPALAVRQNKRIIPLVLSLNGMNFETLTEDQAEKLYSVCYIALTRAHPELSRDDFEGMPISLIQAFRAFPVIVAQAGMTSSGNPPPAAVPAPLPASTGKKSSSRSRARKE